MTEEEKLEFIENMYKKYGIPTLNNDNRLPSNEDILAKAVSLEEMYGTDQDSTTLLTPEEFAYAYPENDNSFDENRELLSLMYKRKASIKKQILELQQDIKNIEMLSRNARSYSMQSEYNKETLETNLLLARLNQELSSIDKDIDSFKENIIGCSRGI